MSTGFRGGTGDVLSLLSCTESPLGVGRLLYQLRRPSFEKVDQAMTVCVAIKVHDCIVFAADSASTLVSSSESGQSTVANIWEHGIKVFNLHRELPIVAMTAGMGHFGPASISNLTKDLRLQLSEGKEVKLDKDDYRIEQVVVYAQDFFIKKYNAISPKPPSPHTFEFWIGGYGSGGTRGEIWKLSIQDGKPMVQELVKAEDDARLVWGGQNKAISRLINGFDEETLSVFRELGLLLQVTLRIIPRVRTPLVHSTMPVQDAINLADFLVDVTKRYFAFLPGANVVGGETDIATVTKHEGFKWIKRKHYYPDHLNRRDLDHA